MSEPDQTSRHWCPRLKEVSRAPQIIEDTLFTTGIVRAPLTVCFDTPTQTQPDHLDFIISSIGKGTLRVPERRCFALCRQKHELLFETAKHGNHLLLVNSFPGSFSSQRSLQHARAVQVKIIPVSNSRRQPPLLAQLFRQEPREPARTLSDQPSTALYTDS